MNFSGTKYISVSSPHTYDMSKKPFPQRVLTQPRFHSAHWKKTSISERGFASDSQESDFESLVQERQYQPELQQRIHENEELVGLYADELESDSLEEGDSLEEMSLREQGVKYVTNQCTNGTQGKENNGREQQSVDKYYSLRYNPNWRNEREVAEFPEAEKPHHVAGGSSVDFSQDSFYLHSGGSPEEKNQLEAKLQDSFSEFGTELLSFHKPDAFISSEPFRLHSRGKGSADGYFRLSPSAHSSAFSLQIQENQPQRAKKDFVEKNKWTLGLHTDKKNSYLQLHSKKQEVLQEQVAGAKTVDEEPVQSVPPSQNVIMDPEVSWCLKSQKLKDHLKKWSQKNKTKFNQNLKGGALPRSRNRQPPRRPAEPKPWHHRTSEFRTAPTRAAEQNNSTAPQKRLCPSLSVGPDTNKAANSKSCLINFPKPRHSVNQDVTTSTYPIHPKLHTFDPAEVKSLAHPSKETKKYQHQPPKGLPHDQQGLYKHATAQFFPREGSTSGQAYPNQRNISSTFNAKSQKPVKDRIPLQDCKRHNYAQKSDHNNAVSSLRPSQSAAAPHTASQLTQTTEQHHQKMSRLKEARLADDRHLFSPLPPIIPQAKSGSEVDPKRGEGNQAKINRSSSEGYLMRMEQQKQPKVNKKPYSSKAYMNQGVKLGGLGPDYEAIKEKKEKLKHQKEYAKQIKEQNMKNIVLVQRLPTKPQVVSSVSRQRALEYAKKIPKPKTFIIKQSDKEVKERRFLPPALKGNSLPHIASLETLRSRHEKEKQVVAAFRTLLIL